MELRTRPIPNCSGNVVEISPISMASIGIAFGAPAGNVTELTRQLNANLNIALDVIRSDDACLTYLSDRLVELGDSVPEQIASFRLGGTNPYKDPEMTDYEHYPESMYYSSRNKCSEPGRSGCLGVMGECMGQEKIRTAGVPCMQCRPCGFDQYRRIRDWILARIPDGAGMTGRIIRRGLCCRRKSPNSANAGIMCGAAAVNLAENPLEEWNGLMGACSTYGSFVYLKYGPMRLFSQTAQDSDIKTGKVLWVAGHSGPETADDSRTHFGIFAPGVTQLFPDGHVIDLHPWEYNEVPVVIAAALRTDRPIIALHLTRPPVEIPDRKSLGIPSHFEAAKGAYILRDYRSDLPRMGCLFIQGTSVTDNIIKILSDLERNSLNVKIVSAVSPQLFNLQTEAVRNRIVSAGDRMDSTIICNRSRRVTGDWMFNPLAAEYAMTSDWDDRWRTGGTLDEVIEEAHLTPEWLLRGIERFVKDRSDRLTRIRKMLDDCR